MNQSPAMRLCCSVALACLFATAGCSGDFDYGDTGKISGRLTMDGTPLKPGHAVRFMDLKKGYLAFGETDAEGNFSVASWNSGNMPIGHYHVGIAPPPGEVKPSTLTPEQAFDRPELVEPASKLEFPIKYADENKSGLEFDVVKGDNHFDIDLKSVKKK